jgi:RIO kinase 2
MSLETFLKKIKELEEEDFIILKELAKKMIYFESIPLETIIRYSKLHEDEVNYRIKRLQSYKLIWKPGGIKRYVLNTLGLDVLAIKKLLDKNILYAIGKKIGVGKESDVYEGITPNEERIALKFFRIGRISFKKYTRSREYIAEEHNRLIASIKAAKKEFEALKILYKENIKVPKPIARSFHTVVTEIFMGTELSNIAKLENAENVLDKIIEELIKIFKLGIIHRDLSPYNILIKPNLEILFIDWPQWVNKNHPMAYEYLRRDIENIFSFFKRKYGIEKKYNEIDKIFKEERNFISKNNYTESDKNG